MQGRKFLFQRSDLNQRTSSVLFNKCNNGNEEYSNSSMNLLPQFNLSLVQPFIENTNDLFYTPPTEKKPASTPKAPVKLKKQTEKGDLRPKRLQYNEDELEGSSIADSGIYTQDNTLCCKQDATKNNRLDNNNLLQSNFQRQLRTSRAKVYRDEVEFNDKENDENNVGKKSTNKIHNVNKLVQESSVASKQNEKQLLEYDNDIIWIEILDRLQPLRDVGLWVQCYKKMCKKWRYIGEYHDPVDVPKKWHCKMNFEKSVAFCSIPEHPLASDVEANYIENAYNAGSIVWALIKGYPWWPGIVNDCPDTYTYYKLSANSIIPNRYYVTFFNEEELKCAWIHKNNLKPFVNYKYYKIIQKTKYNGFEYKKTLKGAYKMATSALSLSILERLRRFSFVALYKKRYNNNNNFKQAGDNIIVTEECSDDEIPCSIPANQTITLREYYSQIITKKQQTQ